MANPHYAYQVCYKFKSTVPARSSRLAVAAVPAATAAGTARRSDELKARILLKRQLLSQQGHRGGGRMGGRGLPGRGKVPPWQRQGYGSRSLPA